MDKKCAARDGNCFGDFGRRFCRSLPAFSCRVLPAWSLAASGLKRFAKSLSDYDPERSIIASLIFLPRRDQSSPRPATNSNCDAHRGKSRTHKSELTRCRLSNVSHEEISTEFQ